jgi:putative ABC transport system permease protein
MIITLIGLVVGLAISLGVTHLMSTLLFGVKPYDIATFATVAVFVSLVALVACYVPARRAAKIDPLVAIRHE